MMALFCFLATWPGYGQEKTLRSLLDLLENAGDPKVKIASAQKLGEISDGTVAPWILKIVKKEKNPAVRLASLQAIANIPDSRILHPLLTFFHSQTKMSRTESVLIKRIFWSHRRSIDAKAWIALAKDTQNISAREIALWTLSYTDSHESLPLIKELLKETEDDQSAKSALLALTILGGKDNFHACDANPSPEIKKKLRNEIQICSRMLSGKERLDDQNNHRMQINQEILETQQAKFVPAASIQYARSPQNDGEKNPSENPSSLNPLRLIPVVSDEAIARTDHLQNNNQRENKANRLTNFVFQEGSNLKSINHSQANMNQIQNYAMHLETIRNIISRNMAKFKNCYHLHVAAKQKKRGGIELALDILESGTLEKLTFVKDSMRNAAFNKCIDQEMKSLKFPPIDLSKVTVNYSFHFH